MRVLHAAPANLRIKHQECTAKVEKWKCQNYIDHSNHLSTLILGNISQLKLFLANIRKYNSCFQMASFGATNIVHESNSCWHVICQHIQSAKANLSSCTITTATERKSQILHIYFMGHTDEQIDVDWIWALNKELSLHYKLNLINTTN